MNQIPGLSKHYLSRRAGVGCLTNVHLVKDPGCKYLNYHRTHLTVSDFHTMSSRDLAQHRQDIAATNDLCVVPPKQGKCTTARKKTSHNMSIKPTEIFTHKLATKSKVGQSKVLEMKRVTSTCYKWHRQASYDVINGVDKLMGTRSAYP